jgi:hypothetical protein
MLQVGVTRRRRRRRRRRKTHGAEPLLGTFVLTMFMNLSLISRVTVHYLWNLQFCLIFS